MYAVVRDETQKASFVIKWSWLCQCCNTVHKLHRA